MAEQPDEAKKTRTPRLEDCPLEVLEIVLSILLVQRDLKRGKAGVREGLHLFVRSFGWGVATFAAASWTMD